MTFNDWHVYVRDDKGIRQGEIDDYNDLEMIPVFCGIGSWTMNINAESPLASDLMLPGWGIVAVRDGITVMSGPTTIRTYTVDKVTNQIELSGMSDDVWLTRRVVSPQPATSFAPYSTTAYDIRTGVASTVIQAYVNVNLGPGAVSNRILANLTMGADPVTGATVTGNGRWDNLLTFIQTLALSGGIGFNIIQGSSGLKFNTYAPTDRSKSVKFSIDLGNLSKFEYTSTAPTANYIYTGGDGDGVTRPILENSDSAAVATWGRIEGDFVSSSGTTSDPVLRQASKDALTAGTEQMSLNISPIDTALCSYGVHYFLGDTVTVQLSKPIRTVGSTIAGQIVSTVQSVDIHLQPGAGAVTIPTISSAPRSMITSLFRDFKLIRKRLNNLERT